MVQYQIRESVSDALEMVIANCNQNVKNEDALLKAWHIGLRDLSDDQIDYGLIRILERSSGFLPSVGEFKQYATTMPGCESIEDEAEEIWGLVLGNLKYFNSPVFKNTAIAEAIRKMGGWKALCHMLEKETPFRKKDFISLYSIYKKRNEEFDPALSGFGEIRNYKFIGYSSREEEEAALLQIEALKTNEKKLLRMRVEKVEQQKLGFIKPAEKQAR